VNRLQKKCFLASTGLHLLLLLVLLIGPAFTASQIKPDTMPVLDFIPLKTVDSALSGGGNPNAKPPSATFEKPQPAPPAPAVKPEPPPPEKVRTPDPPKETVREVPPRTDPEYSLEPSKERKPRKPNIELTPVKRPRVTNDDAKAQAQAEAREEARAEARRERERRQRIAAAFGNAANNLESSLSGSTTIELKGPGGGGVPYANFLQAVKSVYQSAWVVPDGITDENATTAAAVTIARDGTVVSSHITRSSGNAGVDRSVQVTLDRVKWAAPLPDTATENQRTVNINFNVAAKRAAG
jgi:TonB family protein